MDKFSVNKRYFGHDGFRYGQEELIDSILSGRDCLGIMPTGGGKSLCYQIPAILLPGLTLVISPLISLMKDQVAALREAGVPAACLNSAMEGEEYRQVYRGVREHRYRLLYIAPERLDSGSFIQMLREQDISLVAVDEAHCISQWGQDFRPSYLKIADFIDGLTNRPPVAAFTATATEEVRLDIVRLLKLREPAVLVTGFDRPNLFFEVRQPKNKTNELVALLRERAGRSGIVYCATRTKVESVCDRLNREGIPATRYHAGLSDEERRNNQDDFQFDRKSVMVATNAFGMGIDKSNVSFVIHYNMPKSLEAYYQEAGRAGRDGEAADCILLYSGGDVTTAKYLIEHGGDNDALDEEDRKTVRDREYKRLDSMIGYCKTAECLRGYILAYFGQAHSELCGNCGNCSGEYVLCDITIPAQKILSCVKRVGDRLGYSVGSTLIVQVLRGSRDRRLLALGLDRLTTYGIMRSDPRETIRGYIEYLEQLSYLHTDVKYGVLRLTERANLVLYKGERVEMPTRAKPSRTAERKKDMDRGTPAESGENPELLEALKALRSKISQREGVPAYIVFSNASLQDMARKAPQTPAEFLNVSGVGAFKAERYGKLFLDEIQSHLGEKQS